MRVLTYKRTHTGDPDNRGIFGIGDCMGAIRNRTFDAVVGIGSKTPWADSKRIAGKVTWVGIGPFRIPSSTHRGDLIAFEKFVLLDGDGPDFETEAPQLAKRFYEGNARSISKSYSIDETGEIRKLIAKLINSDKSVENLPIKPDDKLASRRKKCRQYVCG